MMVAKTMKDKTKKVIENLRKKLKNIFKFVKSMQKDIEGGQCKRDERGRLGLSTMDRKSIWKEHKEKITNEENDWDQVTNAEMIGPEERIFHAEIINAMKAIK